MFTRSRAVKGGAFMSAASIVLGLMTIGWTADCTWDCEENTLCNGPTTECPGCDPGIGVACSDYTKEEYGNNNIIKRVPGGDRVANFQANVVCHKVTQCANGSTYWPFTCLAGSCQFTGLAPTWCIECADTGAVTTVKAPHYVCTDCPDEY